MNQLRSFIQSSENEDFKYLTECKRIIKTGKQEEFEELCISIKQFLVNDLQRHVSQFSILNLCQLLTKENNQEFNYEHFQKIVLPVIVQYIFINQMYSKELPPKTQQYIKSSITISEELLGYWAHVFPQTQNLQISQFLIEYQLFKKKQQEKGMPILKKKKYEYLKDTIDKTHPNYKEIKQQWKRSQAEDMLRKNNEFEKDQNDIQTIDNYEQPKQEQIHPQKQEQLSEIDQQIINKKQEQDQLIQEIEKLKVLKETLSSDVKLMQQIQQQNSTMNYSKMNGTKSTNVSETITSCFIQGKLIFDEEFQVDNQKNYMTKSSGKYPLCIIDTSYPEKKKRLLDGRGLFHIGEGYQLARDFKLNQNTIDIAIYLICVKKRISDLRVWILPKYEIFSNHHLNKNLAVGKQVLFEIRNIPKQQLIHEDIKIDIVIDSIEIMREEVSFQLKITNIINYQHMIEEDLIKEYQEIKKVLCSKDFLFDSEVFPNGLADVQKCIQHSIIYKNQRQLLVSGNINDQQFIFRIILDQQGNAEVNLKGLECNDEITNRLIQTYIDVLQKNE
ncbi:unnamed protein product [Paramecium sonneborni]|uniref:Uncharacterized protein n=1 Tax=Paramecium sonneborni TaxID=65129 RepID=A0A8S1QQT4_9CILI|nr:unnamed protein product [Paramecium sonneborni]